MGRPYSMDLRERVIAAVEVACAAFRGKPAIARPQPGRVSGGAPVLRSVQPHAEFTCCPESPLVALASIYRRNTLAGSDLRAGIYRHRNKSVNWK
jgi:hypothetical protein